MICSKTQAFHQQVKEWRKRRKVLSSVFKRATDFIFSFESNASVAVSGICCRNTVKCVSRLCWCLGLPLCCYWVLKYSTAGACTVVSSRWFQFEAKSFSVGLCCTLAHEISECCCWISVKVLSSHGNNLFVDDRKKIFWVVGGRKGGVSGSSVRADWLVAFRQS